MMFLGENWYSKHPAPIQILPGCRWFNSWIAQFPHPRRFVRTRSVLISPLNQIQRATSPKFGLMLRQRLRTHRSSRRLIGIVGPDHPHRIVLKVKSKLALTSFQLHYIMEKETKSHLEDYISVSK